MSRLLTLAVLAALCSRSLAAKVLVLQDDPLIRSTHSRYFRELHSQGHTVTIKSVTDSNLKLKDWDDWMYDKLVMFTPSATGRECTLMPVMSLPDLSVGMHRAPPCTRSSLVGSTDTSRLFTLQIWGAS